MDVANAVSDAGGLQGGQLVGTEVELTQFLHLIAEQFDLGCVGRAAAAQRVEEVALLAQLLRCRLDATGQRLQTAKGIQQALVRGGLQQ